MELNDPVTRDYVDGTGFARLCGERGITARQHRRVLRRPEQLVGDLRPVGLQPVRTPGRRILDGGRAKWTAEGRADDHRDAPPRARRLPGGRARRRDHPGLQGRGARPPRPAARRRPVARRVLRRAAAHAGLPAGGRRPRRAHPRCRERAMGQGGRRRRHPRPVPSWRRSTGRSRGCRRRTTSSPTAASASAQPHVVRPHAPVGVRHGAQLRRQLDGVGQRRAGTHRAGVGRGSAEGARS